MAWSPDGRDIDLWTPAALKQDASTAEAVDKLPSQPAGVARQPLPVAPRPSLRGLWGSFGVQYCLRPAVALGCGPVGGIIKMRSLGIVALAAVLAGCGSSASYIAPAYVSPVDR